jgi:hypothetical protein
LKQDEDNKITMAKNPSLDMGDKPNTYIEGKQDSDQQFIVPSSEYPHYVIVRYSDCKPTFSSHDLEKKYQESALQQKGISF